jgi:hypothetical protein
MGVRIGVYHEEICYGQIELDSVFVIKPADYTCEPKGLVSYDEVRQIAKVLRRASGITTGVVGQFAWCRE